VSAGAITGPARSRRWSGLLARFAQRPSQNRGPGHVRSVHVPLRLRRRVGGRSLVEGDAFEELYFRVSQRVLVFLTRRTADPEVAVDLWGETWARAYAARGRFRGTSAAEEEAWMFGIARKTLAGYYKRGAAEQRAMARLGLERPELDDPDLRRLERLAGLGELRDALGEALAQMPEPQREALRLRVVDGLSYAELARTFGTSEQTVRARVSRGLRALAETLSDDRPDLEIPEAP
jgi:RNA polymerase sigma-70 factor (ECF subfamily)